MGVNMRTSHKLNGTLKCFTDNHYIKIILLQNRHGLNKHSHSAVLHEVLSILYLRDYRGISGEGYWSSAPDARAAPLCAAADPAADYRWEARACGGPTVASFICELPGMDTKIF